jgi:hypothetical protein
MPGGVQPYIARACLVLDRLVGHRSVVAAVAGRLRVLHEALELGVEVSLGLGRRTGSAAAFAPVAAAAAPTATAGRASATTAAAAACRIPIVAVVAVPAIGPVHALRVRTLEGSPLERTRPSWPAGRRPRRASASGCSRRRGRWAGLSVLTHQWAVVWVTRWRQRTLGLGAVKGRLGAGGERLAGVRHPSDAL